MAYTPKKKTRRGPPKKEKAERVEVELTHLGPPAEQSVGVVVRDGQAAAIAASRQKTWDERGRLRGGTVGCVVGSQYTGRCVREGIARFLGSEPPRALDKWRDRLLMLEQGAAVEDCFVRPLESALPANWTAVREFEMEAQLSGLRWTGREDICLLDEGGKPRVLVELKNCSSLPHELLFGEKPKTEHLIQLGNYMLRTGLPGQLWYTSRVLWPLPGWSFVRIPDPGEPGYDSLEFSGGASPKPTKVAPFMLGFHVRWTDDGVLAYTRAADRDGDPEPEMWALTCITAAGIDEWYSRVASFVHPDAQGDELPEPPTPIEADGSKKFYKACAYCDWSSVCEVVRTRTEFLDVVSNLSAVEAGHSK